MDSQKPVEIHGECGFHSRTSLQDHVVKHVLDNRDERWWKVLGNDAVSEAREEWRSGKFGRTCMEVATAYQAVISDSIREVCGKGLCHVHLALSSVDPKTGIAAVGQGIRAWPSQLRLFIYASARVRNGEMGRFSIRTGFRPWPGMSERAFERRAREKVRETLRIRVGKLLAVHDPVFSREQAEENRSR